MQKVHSSTVRCATYLRAMQKYGSASWRSTVCFRRSPPRAIRSLRSRRLGRCKRCYAGQAGNNAFQQDHDSRWRRDGCQVAEELAEELSVKLIESSREMSLKLARSFRKTTVIQEEGKDLHLLATEGIMEMDAYIVAPRDEEDTISSCLKAKHIGVKKTIAHVRFGRSDDERCPSDRSYQGCSARACSWDGLSFIPSSSSSVRRFGSKSGTVTATMRYAIEFRHGAARRLPGDVPHGLLCRARTYRLESCQD